MLNAQLLGSLSAEQLRALAAELIAQVTVEQKRKPERAKRAIQDLVRKGLLGFNEGYEHIMSEDEGPAAFSTGTKASRLVAPAKVWNGNMLVSTFNRKMPIGGVRVHLAATFSHNQPV